jgi:glucosamine--fructose-6-phosphate aminotransferase (isomerizing)
MISDIREIPEKARKCYSENRNIQLPLNVPYIGMGSSYFAPLVMKFLGYSIFPEIASEFHHYLAGSSKYSTAVLLSQSGYSSETVWNIDNFKKYDSIVNDPDNPLARSDKVDRVFELHAGVEKCSATKTYINTLGILVPGPGDRLHRGDQYD